MTAKQQLDELYALSQEIEQIGSSELYSAESLTREKTVPEAFRASFNLINSSSTQRTEFEKLHFAYGL